MLELKSQVLGSTPYSIYKSGSDARLEREDDTPTRMKELRSLDTSGATRENEDEDVRDEFQAEQERLKALGGNQIAPGAAGDAVEKNADYGERSPGTAGWLDLLGFGTFQAYYVEHQLSSSTATVISWIGSIQLCLCPLLGCFAGPLFDAGYLKPLIASGGILYVFGLMMASLAKEYYQFLLTHGIAVGLGMGIMFAPSVSTISHHFGQSKYRSLAYGCQAAGSCLGGIVFPILAKALLPSIGFPWTIRIFGFIVLAITVCAFFTLSTVHPPRKRIAILDVSVFKTTAYAIHISGASCVSMAVYCPMTFAVTYGATHGFSASLGNYSLAILNGCSIFGRIVPVLAAQRVGFINIHMTFAFTSAIMLFLWTRATSVPGIMTYDVLYGISSGAYAASFNAAAASFAPHPNQAGLYIGMAFFVTSFFWLSGTPITAALINGNDYLPASMFCGAVVLLGAVLICIARWLRVRTVGTPWV